MSQDVHDLDKSWLRTCLLCVVIIATVILFAVGTVVTRRNIAACHAKGGIYLRGNICVTKLEIIP